MKDFLVIRSKQLEKIKFPQIAIFINILLENPALEEEFIRRSYSRYSHNYESTKDFLIDIGLIEVSNKAVILLDKLNNIDVSDLREEGVFKRFIIGKITKSNSLYSKVLKSFLGKFTQEGTCLVFKPNLRQRLDLSGVRNFLIDFGVIRFDEENEIYVIEEDSRSLWTGKANTKISLSTFLRNKKREERLGKRAEFKILEFEKKRLVKFPSLLRRIKRISEVDVFAGYDILSFEEKQEEGTFLERFIEVKAVPARNFHFYWSKNEIEIAATQKERYYLYLLPTIGKNEFDINKLLIIKNPYKVIFENKLNWLRDIELYSFQKCTGPQ